MRCKCKREGKEEHFSSSHLLRPFCLKTSFRSRCLALRTGPVFTLIDENQISVSMVFVCVPETRSHPSPSGSQQTCPHLRRRNGNQPRWARTLEWTCAFKEEEPAAANHHRPVAFISGQSDCASIVTLYLYQSAKKKKPSLQAKRFQLTLLFLCRRRQDPQEGGGSHKPSTVPLSCWDRRRALGITVREWWEADLIRQTVPPAD